MAIGADALIEFFEGTNPTDITNGSNATVAAGVYSIAGDIDAWINTDDSPEAAFVLKYASTSSPAAGGSVLLYATLLNFLSGNEDETAPTASDESAHLLGQFKIPVATASHITLRAQLPNVETQQEYQFFILNNTNQTMLNTWELHVQSVTEGPHA